MKRKRIFLSEREEPKEKCNDCKKIIKGHVFISYSVPLCADCFMKRNIEKYRRKNENNNI